MRVVMFSGSYGDVTTTFIRNEADWVATHHQLQYVSLRSATSCPPPYVKVLTSRTRPVWDRVNWRLWRADISCDFRDTAFSRRLVEVLEEFQPDVIHCHFAYEALKLLQNLPPDARYPTLIHFHGYDASEMLRKRSYVRALSVFLNKRHVVPIVVSDCMRQELEAAGLDMSKARLLRYGIDTSLFTRPPGDHDSGKRTGFSLLQVSSLTPKKGHCYALLALRQMLDRSPQLRSSVVFTIAGEGPERERLTRLVEALGLQAHVRFLGAVTPTQAVSLLENAHVFVHHSVVDARGQKEGVPNAIMEAMAMQLPILSTHHAGIPELVEHGVHGLLSEECNVAEFSRNMENILSWGFLPANRRRIEEQYERHRHNQKLEQIYLDMAEPTHASRRASAGHDASG